MGITVHLYVILFCAFGCQSSDAVNCSNNPLCKCTLLPDGSVKLNCSRLQLDQCPDIYDNVTIADLSWNNISIITEGQIPSSVVHLDIAHNLINTTSGISFKHMRKLETLNMSFNKVQYLDESSFRYGSALRRLDISNCNLHNVMNGTFRPFANLSYLNISFNKYLTFRAMENLTYDLQFTKIDELDISKLHCTFGPGTVIYQEDFRHLSTTKLRTLHINSNRISEIEKNTLKHLPSTLENVYVRDNAFQMGVYFLDAIRMTGLKSIDGSFQYTTHVPSKDTNEFKSCKDWRPPKVSVFHGDTKGYRRENLSDQRIPLPYNLENVTFEGCCYKMDIPKMVFFNNNSIKRVSVRDNNFHVWKGPVINLKKLEYLDLSNNFGFNISKDFFFNMTSLMSLNISNNLLGFILNTVNPFVYSHKLQHLDLSSNRIETLNRDIFANTSNMVFISLRSNAITTWNFTIKRMKKLRHIDLGNNNIQSIPKEFRQEITNAAKSQNLSINLLNNQMFCDCTPDFLKQLEWIRENRSIFIGFEKYTCFSPIGNLNRILLSNTTAVSEFRMHCSSYVGLIMGVLGAIVLCVSIIICGLIYRFRWKLRYLFYMTKTKYLKRNNRREDVRAYAFDAFVSYSDEDSSLIREQLIDELETKRSFRLCLHQRDFLLGREVAENITDAIHRSRVTIAVITPSYLRSYWCMFEFNMARMESVYARDGDDAIFLVLYKPVPTKSLPLTMLDLIDNKTYIEYPEEEIEENIVFWNGLARAITP